jgi:hypothetical protein
MAEINTEIKTLSDSLIKEIVNALGLPKTPFFQGIFNRVFHSATERLANIGLTTDRLLVQHGLQAAAKWMHSNFCKDVTIHGKEHIPAEGPLLIVSNHSGTYDSLVLASQIGREDLKIIASDISFFKRLPNIAKHIVFLSDKITDRVAATRAGIRQLKDGGAFLIFGTGRIDPDPEVYPNAETFIERWSPSIDLFLRSVPEARMIVSIVSGVLSKRWGYHPITHLRRFDWEKRRLAEFGQVLQQLFFPGSLYLSPRISFAPPVTVEDLRKESPSDNLLPAVIERGKALLQEHFQHFNLSPEA